MVVKSLETTKVLAGASVTSGVEVASAEGKEMESSILCRFVLRANISFVDSTKAFSNEASPVNPGCPSSARDVNISLKTKGIGMLGGVIMDSLPAGD